MKIAFNDMDIKIRIDNIEISVLNIVLEEFERSIPKHSHGSRSYEMHYISSGYGEVTVGEDTYEINPNTLYVTGPHIEHEQIPSKEKPMVEYTIYFKLKENFEERLKRNSTMFKFSETDFWFGQDNQGILQILHQIFEELEYTKIGYKEHVKALLIQCIVKLVRNYGQEALATESVLKKDLNDSKSLVLEESFLYDFATLTLEELSGRLGLSTRQTERFINEYYGTNFREKKKAAKMSAAKILLKDMSLNVSSVAEKLNYSSVQHFSYAFKSYFGESPIKFRRK
ncbi:MAG: AraC family transcriptional regulator [Suipraeoptans sp.]